MRYVILILAILGGSLSPHLAHAEPCCGPITPDGHRLLQFLDNTGVDHLWLSREKVNWETGETITLGKSSSTHCSSFVAAVAKRLGVYVLRPPERTTDLLATAQGSWLRTTGGSVGWRTLSDPTAAQAAANRGELVIASWENPDPVRPGHVAVVRPSLQSAETLNRSGPRIAMAGEENFLNTSTARGFHLHKGAWLPGGQGTIRFYAHPVDWARVP